MTIHLISVGKSVLDFMTDPYGRSGVTDTLADLIFDSGAARVIAGATPAETAARITGCLAGTDAALRAEVAELGRRVRIGDWPSTASAELSTLAKAGGVGSGLPPGDVAVLITSDTSAGLAAAFWNAVALTGSAAGSPGRDGTGLDRVHYLADLGAVRGPADLTPIFKPLRGSAAGGPAVICRVPGLDTADSSGFRAAMGYLGWLGRGLLDHLQEPGEEFRFYLSGGFKATIPYLIGLAEGVRGLARAEVTAWVLHETTNTDKAIRQPLRKLSADVVRSQLAYFDGLTSDRAPRGLQLDGYAYEEVERGKRWELTAFGVGLRNLFGLPAEVR